MDLHGTNMRMPVWEVDLMMREGRTYKKTKDRGMMEGGGVIVRKVDLMQCGLCRSSYMQAVVAPWSIGAGSPSRSLARSLPSFLLSLSLRPFSPSTFHHPFPLLPLPFSFLPLPACTLCTETMAIQGAIL